MKIEYAYPVNLNLLEDAFRSGMLSSSDYSKDFGRNLSLLLSHIKLSFVVSDISIFEAYMLKRFCNGNLIDLGTFMEDSKINPDKYPITNRTLRSLFLLNKNITDDDDVTVKPGVLLFPSKCIEKRCLVTFQGQDVLTILGSITKSATSFFMKVISEMDRSPDTDKTEIISNLLIENFIKEFYSFTSFRIQNIDVLTDSVLDSMYLKYAEDNSTNIVSLSHVNSIYGDLPFINITADDYTNSLMKIEQNRSVIEIENDSNILMNTTELFFVCNTTFYTFMESFIYLPIGSILESTDIKIIYSSDQFIIPQEMQKYQSRVTSLIEKFMGERNSVKMKTIEKLTESGIKENIDVPNHDIDNYNLIPLNTRIQYTVRFKLTEISDILLTWENKIKNDHIYGDNNDYLTREILKMITMMKKYAIAAYKTIIK